MENGELKIENEEVGGSGCGGRGGWFGEAGGGRGRSPAP